MGAKVRIQFTDRDVIVFALLGTKIFKTADLPRLPSTARKWRQKWQGLGVIKAITRTSFQVVDGRVANAATALLAKHPELVEVMQQPSTMSFLLALPFERGQAKQNSAGISKAVRRQVGDALEALGIVVEDENDRWQISHIPAPLWILMEWLKHLYRSHPEVPEASCVYQAGSEAAWSIAPAGIAKLRLHKQQVFLHDGGGWPSNEVIGVYLGPRNLKPLDLLVLSLACHRARQVANNMPVSLEPWLDQITYTELQHETVQRMFNRYGVLDLLYQMNERKAAELTVGLGRPEAVQSSPFKLLEI